MPTRLSVNLNKIALLRNARGGGVPSVVDAAACVLDNGGDGITVHPRPDQRHIRPHDVADLAEYLAKERPEIEFNIEGNPSAGPTADGYPGFHALIENHAPAQATLVPDSDNQLTSDHGFDLSGDTGALRETIARYQAAGARVSLFMDPDHAQIERAKGIGADRIELYTGPFAHAVWTHGADSAQALASYALYDGATQFARDVGLGVNAGHDLDLSNLPLFRRIEGVDEVSIGHALISDALYHGLAETVRAYRAALSGDTPGAA